MRYLIAIVMALAANNALAATVFKCELPNGQTQFSDQPCPGDVESEQIEVTHEKSGVNLYPSTEHLEFQQRRDIDRERQSIQLRRSSTAAQMASAPCRTFNSSELRTLIIRHNVVSGMKRADALRAWGSPTRINGDQHAYHWARGGSSYFYVRNGCVNTVQGQWGG